QHRAAFANRRADVPRADLTLHLEVEVRADGAVPRLGVQLAVVVRRQGELHIAAPRVERHVLLRAQRRHPDVDVAITAAHLDRALYRHDVHVAVAGGDVHTPLRVPDVDLAVARRDTHRALGLADVHATVPRGRLHLAPGAVHAQ